MGKLLWILCAAIVLSLLPMAAMSASPGPHVSIYFDEQWTQAYADCPGGPQLGYLYVVAEGFNAFISAIEFRVDYPPQLGWLGDQELPPVAIGNTPTGISMGWTLPQNGFFPLLLTKVAFLWQCPSGDCTGSAEVPVCPNVHPISGFLRAVRYPDQAFIMAGSWGACLCPLVCLGCGEPTTCVCPELPVPTEPTSWGKIKSLYQ